MKQSIGAVLVFACAGLIASALDPFPVHAGTILKQFGSFKSVNAVIPLRNNLWLATSGGVVKYDQTTRTTRVYSDISDIPDLNITGGAVDTAGDLWFGTASGFLIHCHPQTETFNSFNALAATNWQVGCMARSGGFLFIGTQKGLGIFNIARKSFQNATQFGTSTKDSVSEIRVFGDTIALIVPD
jgi:streptogramin lyase